MTVIIMQTDPQFTSCTSSKLYYKAMLASYVYHHCCHYGCANNLQHFVIVMCNLKCKALHVQGQDITAQSQPPAYLAGTSTQPKCAMHSAEIRLTQFDGHRGQRCETLREMELRDVYTLDTIVVRLRTL